MRRRPVSRDEIRFNGSRITTLPVDSVKVPRRGTRTLSTGCGNRCSMS